MKIIVNPHSLELEKTIDVNSGEYNIQKCEFEFSNEYNGLTKMAIFSNEDNSFQTIIIGNECIIPYEILQVEGTIGIGVFGYELDGENLVKRYSPKPVFFNVELGSYQYAQETEQPSQDIIDQILSQIASQGDDIIALQNNLDNLEDNVIPTLALKSEIPTKTSQLTNDSNFATLNDIPDVSNFITKDVDNLTNYTKTSSLSSVALSGTYSDLSGTPDLSLKQDTLVSGTNIKTINNESILGSGNINISGGGSSTDVQINGTSITSNDTANIITKGEYNPSSNKIATESDLPDTSSFITKSVNDLTNYTTTTDMNTALSGKQDTLVSGTNIKTIDGTSVLGSGDIDTGLITLSYGNSTWQDFLDAYNSGKIVYCKASSNSDPSIGTQSRMAFMAYVNYGTTGPRSAEFQYYRSISSHSAAQQADQVVIYKLYNTGVWEVTTREAGTKIVAGTGLTSSYSNGALTLNTDIQRTTMPTASATYEGRVVQYTGTTDSTYTNGYFYQCVSDGQSTPTYSWEQLDVQPSSGGSEDVAEIYACDFDSWASVSNTIKEKIYAILNKTTDEKRKILLLNTNRNYGPQLFHCNSIYDNSIIYLSTEGTIQETGNSDTQLKTFTRQIRIYSNRITLTDNKYAVGGPYLASNNDYSTPYTPKYAGSPATKKYVDDQVGAINTILATLTTPSNNGGE